MRDVGKHFSVNAMMAKESVKRRLEGDEGISYTEFSYPLLQSYDFLVLHDRFNCSLQIGGSDQWGNITAGMDLIRRVRGAKAHCLVSPLLMTAAGTKFGKTEAGTIWLDPAQTTPYEFYQFWLNADDRDAVRYLKFFTFLDQGRVSDIAEASAREPEKRHAQRELAREVTRLVHGEGAVGDAETKSASLFSRDPSTMSSDELLQAFANETHAVAFQPDGWRVQTLLTEGGLAKSLGEAARLIRGRGVRVNGELFTDEMKRLQLQDAKDGQLFLIQKGKKDFLLVRIEQG
jgi:tyrosyl-tRNA synthetase